MAENTSISGLMRLLGPFGPRPRLTISIIVGIVVGFGSLALPEMELPTHLILGWDALSVTFLAAMFLTMLDHSPTDIRARAIDDEGKGVILTLILAAAAASVWAVGAELSLAKNSHGLMKAAHIVLAFTTVVGSWMMVQMVFALHYAHEYYGVDRDDGVSDAEGLNFPGTKTPDYWYFFHFSVVIGAACATADVAFTSRGLRRLGTLHSLVAFAFNTVIVALTINLTAGLF